MTQTAQGVLGYIGEDLRFNSNNSIVKTLINKRVIVTPVDDDVMDNANVYYETDVEKRIALAESLRGIIPPDIDLKAMRDERLARKGLL
jgi:hypothetical protein